MTYGLLVLFMLFLITANPASTGQNGREFASWLSGGWDDARTFVGSLMGDDDGEPDVNEFGEVVIPTTAPAVEATTAPVPAQEPAPTVAPEPPGTVE